MRWVLLTLSSKRSNSGPAWEPFLLELDVDHSAASLALPPPLFFDLPIFASTGFKNCPV